MIRVNIGALAPQRDRERFGKLIDFIESNGGITTNPAYRTQKQLYVTGQEWIRDGYKFEFDFESFELAQLFCSMFNGTIIKEE